MDAIKQTLHKLNLAFSKGGLGYVVSRIPSIIFWTMVSTGLLIGVQFVFYTLTPAQFFFTYDSPAVVRNTELGSKPIMDYCRSSKGDYTIEVTSKLQKIDPPIYVQDYQVKTTLPKGHGCLTRELMAKPTQPGKYKMYFTIKATLPYGIAKYTDFESKEFTVNPPNHIYKEYSLTVLDNADGVKDGVPNYKPGGALEYQLQADQLIETFGTTERHLVCGNKDIFVDSYSGKTLAGPRDSINRTLEIPTEVSGTCRLELRLTSTVEGISATVAETLRSNDFRVQ